jgi:hypothetical protein
MRLGFSMIHSVAIYRMLAIGFSSVIPAVACAAIDQGQVA